jgi:hypothetical protein
MTPVLCDRTAKRFGRFREAQQLRVGVRSNPPIFPRQAEAQLFKVNWSEAITLVGKYTGPICGYPSNVVRSLSRARALR